MLSLLHPPPPPLSNTREDYSFKLEIISAALCKATGGSVHMIQLAFNCVAFNDFTTPLHPKT